jgi:phosphoenolpyruvate carboxykinase (GTP)
MAMKPFAGYNFGDYWQHWLGVGARLSRPPGIFHVNWFRQDAAGRFLWPGFGENLRVLEWVLGRVDGTLGARDTPIGFMPAPEDLDVGGLSLEPQALAELLSVDRAAWREEYASLARDFEQYGERLPAGLRRELEAVLARLG